MRKIYEVRFNRGKAEATLAVIETMDLKIKTWGFEKDYGYIKIKANPNEIEELKRKLNKYVGTVKEWFLYYQTWLAVNSVGQSFF